MLSLKFWINYRSFISVVLCTQTLHQQWLHTRTCYKSHSPATIMVISLSLRFVDQIGTSVRFWPKIVKCWNFEGDCEQNGSTGKVATWGFLVVFSFFEKTTYCCRARRLSVRLSVRPSVRPSVRLSVCPSVEIISFRGNSLSNRPIELKIGLNVREGVVHVRKVWFFEILIASCKSMQFANICK